MGIRHGLSWILGILFDYGMVDVRPGLELFQGHVESSAEQQIHKMDWLRRVHSRFRRVLCFIPAQRCKINPINWRIIDGYGSVERCHRGILLERFISS